MYTPEHYIVVTRINKLVNMLLDEGVDRKDILDALDLYHEEAEYFDLTWLQED